MDALNIKMIKYIYNAYKFILLHHHNEFLNISYKHNNIISISFMNDSMIFHSFDFEKIILE